MLVPLRLLMSLVVLLLLCAPPSASHGELSLDLDADEQERSQAQQTNCTNITCTGTAMVCVVSNRAAPVPPSPTNGSSGSTVATCQHKPLLPLAACDIEAGVALLFGLALASAGGVGGGALVVPILMLLNGWDAGATVPFAQLCGFATAVPRFLMAVGKSHPNHPERPLIGASLHIIITSSSSSHRWRGSDLYTK
jgi:hypothetical protein